MWGSDYPLFDDAASYRALGTLGLTPDETDQRASLTARELYRL